MNQGGHMYLSGTSSFKYSWGTTLNYIQWIFNFEAPSQALDEVAWDAAVRTLCLRSPPP